MQSVLGDLARILRCHDTYNRGDPLTTEHEKRSINESIHITLRFGVREPGEYPKYGDICKRCGRQWDEHDSYRCPPNFEYEEDCYGPDN